MRYAFMSFSAPEQSLPELLATARKYGYDGIEPRLDARHAHGVETAATSADRETMRRQVADSGIAMACLATSLNYADPSRTAERIEATHARIDLAGDLGVPVIRVFGGGLPQGLGRDDAIRQVADCLKAVADHAAARQVVIAMETHDAWCDPAHVAAVMERVEHPSIGVNWDIMHPVRVAAVSIDASYKTLKPWIRHLHVHDSTTADKSSPLAPIGSGPIDHRRALELIVRDGYTGFISGEWIKWEPADVHLPRELAKLKEYESELTA